MLTTQQLQQLHDGGRLGAELPATRVGYRRFVVVSGDVATAQGAVAPDHGWRVHRYEVLESLVDARPGKENLLDYDAADVDDATQLEAAIAALAGGPVTLSERAGMDAPR